MRKAIIILILLGGIALFIQECSQSYNPTEVPLFKLDKNERKQVLYQENSVEISWDCLKR